jgi:hypothetical protein
VNSLDISGATNPTLLVRTVTTNHTGDYRAIIWNDAGRATSFVAHVEVRSLGALDRWIWRRSLPQGNTLNALAAGHGRIVAVGERGSVAFSTNGLDWRDGHRDGRARDREAIVFGNDVFVALSGSWPEVSSNGVDWVDTSFPDGFYASSVAFGNGRFVAVGYSESLAISTNGIHWELHDVSGLERRSGEVNFADGRFFISLNAIPGLGIAAGVLVSTDGMTWAFHESPLGAGLQEIAYGHAGFVGIQEYRNAVVALSSNGTDWVEQFIPELVGMAARSVAYGKGLYLVAGFRLGQLSLGLASSTNGIDWTPNPGIGTNSILKLFFDGTRFTAVGLYGFIAVSDNGLDWTVISPGSERNFRAISHENGLFIAVGNDGAILTSPDGRQWSPRHSGTTNNLRAVTWFKGRFIVVGEGAQDGTATILSSPDGAAWQSNTARGNLFGVAHNGERLVAVGDGGAIATSLDGLSWNNLPLFPPAGPGSPTSRDLNAVIWSDNRFVAVGKDGVVIHSTNGLHWISSGPGGGRNLHGIAYGNGVFVTVANNASYYISTNLTLWLRGDWTPREDMSDVIFGGGRFLAVGDNGLILTSEDGTDWLRRVTVCDNDLRSVAYVEGSYYAAGNNDTILQSGQADAALRITRLNVPGGVQLEILGEAGRAYRLQGSVDLVGWTDLLSFIASTEAARYVDGLQGASDWRFYRVISP